MKVPLDWLHEYVRPDLETDELAERLALTGTEVERVEHHGVGSPDAFVVGKVLSADQHPDADRLTVCSVDTGDGEPAQIVCGAPNVAAGQTVAVARPGAVMPDGTRLGTAKLRGVESSGMILAEDEVAIGPNHAGIMELPGGLAAGTPLADALPIATDVIEFEITPNRPDCLGVYGIAREVHAATGAPLSAPPWSDDPGTPGDVEAAEVVVENPELCPRFTARVFENVTIAESPHWLKARLTAAGQRPISNVVDISNYVMLLTGHPVHAFDLDQVAGGRLVVRRARDGEPIETLDGAERKLDEEMVVICDEHGPTSIAGVMGGARSEVSDGTTRVLMEVANWIGPNIHRTSLRLGLRSEASARFEKQLSPEAAMEGQAMATKLMLDLTGAALAAGTIDVGGAPPPPPPVRLREARVEGLLGAPVSRERCTEILEALEFVTSRADEGLDILVPHFRRNDVSREADLIEEVARIDGLDRVPATLPHDPGIHGRLSDAQRFRRAAEDVLAERGCHEIVGWSFTPPDLIDRLRLPEGDPRRRTVTLANPLSEDQSVLRTTLLGSLLNAAQHNTARGMRDVHVFETGAVYLHRGDGELPDEAEQIGALLVGAARPATWREPEPPPADFYAAKGLLQSLLDRLRVSHTVRAAEQPFLHPGRSAEVVVRDGGGDDEVIGWVGELHPVVAAGWDLDGAAAFQLRLAGAMAAADLVPVYEDVTSFPAVRQDLAVVVADDVSADRVLSVVRDAGGDTLHRVEVFDVYRGEQAGPGRVSLALRLEFRAPDRTLTDEDVAGHRERIAAALSDLVGGELRA